MPRTLVRVPNWLGDIVMALPALRALAVWPGAGTLALAAPAAFVPIARMIDGIDHVVPIASTGRAWGRAFAADVARLREGRYDRVVLLTNSFGSAWMARRAGVPERLGYRADGRGLLLTRAVARRAGAGDSRHHSHYYLRLLSRLGIPVPGDAATAWPRLAVPAAAREAARRVLAERGLDVSRPIVGFAPGAAFGAAKRWPPDQVAEVVAALAAEGIGTVVVGAAADRPTRDALESAFRERPGGRGGVPPFADLVGRTDLTALTAVLAECAALVSNDSGAMHVAAAVGTPVVAVFGPTDEQATAPLGEHTIVSASVFCRPCHLRTCPIDHRCMRRVTPAQVLAATKGYLARGGRS